MFYMYLFYVLINPELCKISLGKGDGVEKFLENSRIKKTLSEVNGNTGKRDEKCRKTLQNVVCSPGSLVLNPFLLQQINFHSLANAVCAPNRTCR